MTIQRMKLLNELIKKDYSESSASILIAQYSKHPDNPKRWGTEKQTRKDMEKIISKYN